MKPTRPFIQPATFPARLPTTCMKLKERGEQFAPGTWRGSLKYYFAPLARAPGAAPQVLRQSAWERLKQVFRATRQRQDRARLFGLDASGKLRTEGRAQNGRVRGQIAKIAAIPQLGSSCEMIEDRSGD